MHSLSLSQKTGTSENTPCGKTGCNRSAPYQLGVDWLAGTFPEALLERVIIVYQLTFDDLVSPTLGPDGSHLGSQWYRRGYKSVLGAFFGEGNRASDSDNPKARAYINLPGAVLDSISYEKLYDFFQSLDSLGFQPSRMDFKLDDFTKKLTPRLCWEAVQSGNYKGSRSWKWIESNVGRLISTTLYLGRRGKNGAGKFIRVYDKFIESNGKIDSVRLELELSDKKAKDAWVTLVACPLDCWPECILGWIKASVTFIDRSGLGAKKRADRCQLLPWWAAIVEHCHQWTFTKRVITRSYQKIHNWVQRQVVPGLALLMDCFSVEADRLGAGTTDFLQEVLLEWHVEGSNRYQQYHRDIISQFQRQFLVA